jgi:anti-sigma regulatory factor (Ser/Thr protein kinase)
MGRGSAWSVVPAGVPREPVSLQQAMPTVPVHTKKKDWKRRVQRVTWPLQSYLELGALPGAVPSARLHVRLVLHEWRLAESVETVELIVSELITNAVQASQKLTGSRYRGRWRPGMPPVRLWLESDREQVLVQVWDGNDQLPELQEPEPDADHGRGLLIVENLSAKFGVYRPERSSGKVVWALCEC